MLHGHPQESHTSSMEWSAATGLLLSQHIREGSYTFFCDMVIWETEGAGGREGGREGEREGDREGG